MHTILWFWYFWCYLLRVQPKMRQAEALLQQGKQEECDEMVGREAHQWALALLKKAGITMEVEGLENLPAQGAMVLAPNHQGYFDIPLMLGLVPRTLGFFSKIEVKRIPLIPQWMEKLHCVFVARSDRRSSMQSVHDAVNILKKGHSLVIFPEGTRSKGGPVKSFKQGAFKIAQKAHVPVVPVCIAGSYKAMEANGNWIKPAHVQVRILPPVETEGLSREELGELCSQVQQSIEQQLEQMQASA
ncbi:MAG: lysophospholipid acyltransferase family protein [Eubacteriales bacterium]|jgi:1-acyl-sn-glycerol-3-phosphate acyltransferase